MGLPETLQVRRRELPALRRGETMARVEATGVSFAEQGMRRGRYPGQPPFPFVPGYDIVGVVTALGEAAADMTVGQRVPAVTKVGGWADHVVLPAFDLVRVPDGWHHSASAHSSCWSTRPSFSIVSRARPQGA